MWFPAPRQLQHQRTEHPLLALEGISICMSVHTDKHMRHVDKNKSPFQNATRVLVLCDRHGEGQNHLQRRLEWLFTPERQHGTQAGQGPQEGAEA